MDKVASAAPLMLYLKLAPEHEPSPSETADVPQSIDDLLRFVERYSLMGTRAPDLYALWDPAFVGHGETPIRLEKLHFGSPMEILVEIPWSLVRDGLLTASGLWMFLTGLERIWNMPKRIRVESARLDAAEAQHERDELHARLESADIERQYWAQRKTHSGRFLQGEPDPPAFRALEGCLYDQEVQPPRQAPEGPENGPAGS